MELLKDGEDVPLALEMMGLLIGAVDEAESYSVLMARFPQQPMALLVVVASSAERVLVACPRGSIEQGVPTAPSGAPAASVSRGVFRHRHVVGSNICIYSFVLGVELGRSASGSEGVRVGLRHFCSLAGPWVRAWCRKLDVLGF